MNLRSDTENENRRLSFDPKPHFLQRVRHSRMFLAGIQAEFGLDPRLRHSGVTVWEWHRSSTTEFSRKEA
jgi:hypothetical protein